METIDAEKCRVCQGRCCKIYTSHLQGGSFPEGFVGEKTHRERWRMKFLESGAYLEGERPPESRFDPLESEGDGNCEFLGPAGCQLPRERMPVLCRTFMCD